MALRFCGFVLALVIIVAVPEPAPGDRQAGRRNPTVVTASCPSVVSLLMAAPAQRPTPLPMTAHLWCRQTHWPIGSPAGTADGTANDGALSCREPEGVDCRAGGSPPHRAADERNSVLLPRIG